MGPLPADPPSIPLGSGPRVTWRTERASAALHGEHSVRLSYPVLTYFLNPGSWHVAWNRHDLTKLRQLALTCYGVSRQRRGTSALLGQRLKQICDTNSSCTGTHRQRLPGLRHGTQEGASVYRARSGGSRLSCSRTKGCLSLPPCSTSSGP